VAAQLSSRCGLPGQTCPQTWRMHSSGEEAAALPRAGCEQLSNAEPCRCCCQLQKAPWVSVCFDRPLCCKSYLTQHGMGCKGVGRLVMPFGAFLCDVAAGSTWVPG
jgi:hypothetical protein